MTNQERQHEFESKNKPKTKLNKDKEAQQCFNKSKTNTKWIKDTVEK